MKRYFKTSIVIGLLFTLLSSFSALMYSAQPPAGKTGASGVYCTQCHTNNPLNTGGGNVSVNGLPETYTAGASYNFAVNITHGVADRKRWGFELTAINSNGQVVGTFSSANPNAALIGTSKELGHLNAVITPSQQSFTYDNLTWTAPINPGVADETVTFYFASNAANGPQGASTGDFIYASTKVITLAVIYTFTGNGNWDDPANWSNNAIPPAILDATSTIVIDPPADGECVLNVIQHVGSKVNFKVNDGKKFRILGDLVINNP